MKKSLRNGQGTIEYLIIIAIVIVVALLLMSIIFGLSNIGTISENDAKLKWKNNTEWAITDWYSNETELIIILKNNSQSNLSLNFVTISDTNNNPLSQNTFAPNEEKQLTFNKTCDGSSYYYSSVEINYASSLIPNRKQSEVAPILGKCPNQS